MPTARDLRGQVPRNHLGHSSKISTESPTSKGRPKRTSPCQLCIAEKGIKEKHFMLASQIIKIYFNIIRIIAMTKNLIRFHIRTYIYRLSTFASIMPYPHLLWQLFFIIKLNLFLSPPFYPYFSL